MVCSLWLMISDEQELMRLLVNQLPILAASRSSSNFTGADLVVVFIVAFDGEVCMIVASLSDSVDLVLEGMWTSVILGLLECKRFSMLNMVRGPQLSSSFC